MHVLDDDSITTVGPSPAADAPRVRWGAVFAGTLVAAGLWLLLHVLGLAVGLVALDPVETRSLRGLGVGTGIWSVLAPMLALFLGGLATGRLCRGSERMPAAIHGALVWSLGTFAGVAVLWKLLGALLGGVASAGATVAATGGAMAGAVAQVVAPEELVQGSSDLAAANQRLRAQGLPEVTGDQVMRAVGEGVRASMQTGRFDRQAVVDALARETALAPGEASELAAAVEHRYDQRLQALADTAREQAIAAAEGLGKLMLGLVLALALGLTAAVLGALLGVRERVGRRRERTRVVVET